MMVIKEDSPEDYMERYEEHAERYEDYDYEI